MSGDQMCPRGHLSGRIVTDGELVIQGQEHFRYRCVLPDGSFHRFMAVTSQPARTAPPAPAPVALGRPVGTRLDDSTAFLPSQRSRRIEPALGGVHPSLPVPPLVPPRPPRRSAVDRLAVDETTRLDPVAIGWEEEPAPPAASPERARRVLVLPSPPTDEEKYWYLGAQNRWFLWVGAATGLLVLASLVRFAFERPITWAFLALVFLRVVTSAVGLVTSSRRRREDALDHEGRVVTWQPLVYPSVDVFLPSAGEELEVLANTYLHISRLQWPGRLVVHVLDDSGRQDVADLAAGYGFRYQSRPDKGVMKKAGNLKNGFET
jgi:hypothetical protein